MCSITNLIFSYVLILCIGCLWNDNSNRCWNNTSVHYPEPLCVSKCSQQVATHLCIQVDIGLYIQHTACYVSTLYIYCQHFNRTNDDIWVSVRQFYIRRCVHCNSHSRAGQCCQGTATVTAADTGMSSIGADTFVMTTDHQSQRCR